MASARESFKRRLFRLGFPFLFKMCPQQNYHWFRDRFCFCGLGQQPRPRPAQGPTVQDSGPGRDKHGAGRVRGRQAPPDFAQGAAKGG